MNGNSIQGKFIEKAEALVLEQISNEQFGVSELADRMNMSRSNLLRKIKRETQRSASRFIREVRLKKAMELLQNSELTVSEISYQVGFGNNSYFIKCFKDLYGLPPGEVRKGMTELPEKTTSVGFFSAYRLPIIIGSVLILLTVAFLYLGKPLGISGKSQVDIKKSIAVLPFKNMSSDSTNLYFVNGLMESTLSNLQKINDLRVISRTSVEKYRNTDKTTSEIADELKVSYLVEGSGQYVGDEVLLNIRLIEASNDSPIWTEQYQHKAEDIFALQNNVAKKISKAIQARVTPAELQQIDKKPTENLLAYDFYLRALEPFQAGTKEGLEAAIPLFRKALAEDPKFALAYSKLAVCYYYLDIYQTKKQYTDTINNFADKALLYDSTSAESLIAKALYYINMNEFRLAIPHLEKALEYNPNSATVVQILADLYARVIPDTGKYLKYALKGIQLDIEANDSVGKSFIYLHLSNALIQNGFTKEAKEYINSAIAYNPKNYYASYLKIFIEYAQQQNLKKATDQLVSLWKEDTTRLDLMQEVAKFYYIRERYDSAYYYYDKFVRVKESKGLNIYPQEDIKIATVYKKMGFPDQAQGFFEAYSGYCDRDISIYQPASLAMKYLYEGKQDLAIEQLKQFATRDNFFYWIPLFIEKDPMMKPLKNHPDYKATIKKIDDKFWENHRQLENTLKENHLM